MRWESILMVGAVAATVISGEDAVVGDVVVATVVCERSVESKFGIETYSNADGHTSVCIYPNGSNSSTRKDSLVGYKAVCDVNSMFVVWSVEHKLDPRELVQRDTLKAFVDGVSLISVVGFCPKTSRELEVKVNRAIAHSRALVTNKFGDIGHTIIRRGIPPEFPIKFPMDVEPIKKSMDDRAAGFACAHVFYTAERIATAIRVLKLMDMSILYPSLKLMSNYGYCTPILCSCIRDAHFVVDMDETPGFRGEITRQWLQSTPELPRNSSQSSRDMQGRKVIVFDRTKATDMTKVLTSAGGLSEWENAFILSVAEQLCARDLTGRQMFILERIYNKVAATS